MLRRRHGSAAALLHLTVLPITPLVDVSLLLAVFLLLVMDDSGRQSIPVALPEAGTGTGSEASALGVTIDAAGNLRVDGAALTLDALAARAKGAARATLHADTKVAHGRVVAVVDVLRKAGVERIFYATVPVVEDL